MGVGPESRVYQKIGPCVSYCELGIGWHIAGMLAANSLEFRREKNLNCSLTVFIQIYDILLHRGRTRYRAVWQLRWWYFATLVGCECTVLILVTLIMHARLCMAITTILSTT